MYKPVILCVDDEPVVLESLEIELKRTFGKKYQYEFAESAEEALEIIEELDHDASTILVLISDWLMPGIKGDEFLIQVHKKFPKIIKVMLTGQADSAAIQRAREQADLYRCLYKPWRREDLIEIINAGLTIQ